MITKLVEMVMRVVCQTSRISIQTTLPVTKKAESVGVTAFADVTFVLDDAQTKARKCCSSSVCILGS